MFPLPFYIRGAKYFENLEGVLNSAGESVDVSDGDAESVALTESSGQTLREKMVYMSVGDSHHNQGNHGESLEPTRGGDCHETERC